MKGEGPLPLSVKRSLTVHHLKKHKLCHTGNRDPYIGRWLKNLLKLMLLSLVPQPRSWLGNRHRKPQATMDQHRRRDTSRLSPGLQCTMKQYVYRCFLESLDFGNTQ